MEADPFQNFGEQQRFYELLGEQRDTCSPGMRVAEVLLLRASTDSQGRSRIPEQDQRWEQVNPLDKLELCRRGGSSPGSSGTGDPLCRTGFWSAPGSTAFCFASTNSVQRRSVTRDAHAAAGCTRRTTLASLVAAPQNWVRSSASA